MILLPTISLAFVTVLTRYITKSWLSPGTFFSLCWSFFIIFPIIFAYEYKIDPLALWFITIFSMSLAAGSIMAYSSNSICPLVNKNNQSNPDYKFLYYTLWFFSLISFIGIYLLLRYAITTYSSLNYVIELNMIPNMIAVNRYADNLSYPYIIKYSLYFIYPGNLLGGLLFGQEGQSKKIKFASIFPLIAAILLGIIEGARTSLLLGLILFFSSWLSAFMIRSQQTLKSRKSYYKLAFGSTIILAVFTMFFIFIQWLRQGMDVLVIDLLIDRIRAYFFGYLAAFSEWLIRNPEINFYNGLITFAGPFNLIGIMERPLGFYDPIYIADSISTNIFTAFRGFITDFSIPGAIIIAFIIGFIVQLIIQKNNKKTLFSSLPISMFYAFTLYSPLISIFHYNSIIFSWLILLIIIILDNHEPLDNHS